MAKKKAKRGSVKINELPRENEELSSQELQDIQGGESQATGSQWQQPTTPAQGGTTVTTGSQWQLQPNAPTTLKIKPATFNQ